MKELTTLLFVFMIFFNCMCAGTPVLVTDLDFSNLYMPVVSQEEQRRIIIEDYYVSLVPEEYKEFFRATCSTFNAPAEIVYGIIYHESRFDSTAVNYNTNGSKDTGMGQLNSTFLISYYVKKYWDKDEPFEVFNAEHNLYIAIKHIGFLNTIFDGSKSKIIMAYHLGIRRVAQNRVPKHGFIYLNKVQKHISA